MKLLDGQLPKGVSVYIPAHVFLTMYACAPEFIVIGSITVVVGFHF